MSTVSWIGGGLSSSAGARHPDAPAPRRLPGTKTGHGLCFVDRMLPSIAGGWVLGLFTGAQWQSAAAPVFLGATVVSVLPLALHGHLLKARLWTALLAVAALGCGLGVLRPAGTPCTTTGNVLAEAVVESVRHGETDARVRLRLLRGRMAKSGERISAGQRVRTRLPVDRAPPPGSTVRLVAELHPRTELRNPIPRSLLSVPRRECWARLTGEELEILAVRDGVQRLEEGRARVRAHLRSALPEQTAAVARALVLGDGAALGYERRRTIASVGLAHLFAVSGLHVALVSGTLVSVLRWLLIGWVIRFDPRRLAAGLGVPLTLLHAAFAGGSPSAWRAAITAALTWLLVAFAKRPSAPAVTAAAALILSAPNPAIALRPAFLLSIVATSAILSAPRAGVGRRWSRIRLSAVVSARTLIATAPMVWWWFGGVPLVGWVTNIVVLPFGSAVVIPLAHLFATTLWLPVLVEPVGTALSLAVDALLALCEIFAPLAVTEQLPPLDPVQGLIVVAACGLLLVLRGTGTRLWVLLACGALWIAVDQAVVAREQPRGVVRVTFVDVGQGDAALVDLPDGRLALIDSGQGGRHPATRELRALLQARRRAWIDLVIVSHGHPDHFGGLDDLLPAVGIGEIWLNGQLLAEERDQRMERLLSAALVAGTKLRFAPELCETTTDFGGAMIEVLSPCPRYDPALDLNDNSLTVRLRYGRRVFLFTGDLEAEGEARLVESGRLGRADVLKVAHHGSRTSTTEGFLAAARPSVAVISSGAGNRYGHPSEVVLDRLRRAGAKVLRTDLGGAVVVTTDGTSLEVDR